MQIVLLNFRKSLQLCVATRGGAAVVLILPLSTAQEIMPPEVGPCRSTLECIVDGYAVLLGAIAAAFRRKDGVMAQSTSAVPRHGIFSGALYAPGTSHFKLDFVACSTPRLPDSSAAIS